MDDKQSGDTTADNKITPAFESDYEYKNIHISYPSMMENKIRRLKHSMEQWREITLHVRQVLVWDRQWHPTAIIGGSTILFTFLWLLEPSILTVVSVFGLCLTVGDYMVPSIAKTLFKPERWTTKKESEYEELCTNIVLYKAKLELAWARYYRLKTTNKKMYFAVTVLILTLLAWIGCTFNNLFLCYLLVTFLLLFPGLEHNGIMDKWCDIANGFFLDVLRQNKAKVQDKKD